MDLMDVCDAKWLLVMWHMWHAGVPPPFFSLMQAGLAPMPPAFVSFPGQVPVGIFPSGQVPDMGALGNQPSANARLGLGFPLPSTQNLNGFWHHMMLYQQVCSCVTHLHPGRLNSISLTSALVLGSLLTNPEIFADANGQRFCTWEHAAVASGRGQFSLV